MFDRKVLMCSPVHFSVNYEINPWMKKENQIENQKAMIQWQQLHHLLIRLGCYVEYSQPVKDLPDNVFTSNAGLCKDKKIVISNFKFQERQQESNFFRSRFRSFDFEIYELPRSMNFEGAGDALFVGRNKLFAGCGQRSDRTAFFKIASFLEIDEIIFCDLVDERFFHLDLCFLPLDEENALYFPAAFDQTSVERMKNSINLIPVTEEEAKRFACNSIVIGKNVITPMGLDITKRVLQKMNFEIHECDMSEFIKSGGACRSLMLTI